MVNNKIRELTHQVTDKDHRLPGRGFNLWHTVYRSVDIIMTWEPANKVQSLVY